MSNDHRGVLGERISPIRKTIIINQNISTASTFFVNLRTLNLTFQPRHFIIRQALYCNIAGADAGTYLLFCDLTGDYICAVNVGIQANIHCPETQINMATFQETLGFRLDKGNTAFAGPSGLLTLTLEFF